MEYRYNEYIDDVLSGRITTCRMVRLAWEGKSYKEELFRAGFWCGRNIREILEKMEAADENGEAD